MRIGSSYGKEKYGNSGHQPADPRTAAEVLQTQPIVSDASDPGIGVSTSDGDDITVFDCLHIDKGFA